MMGLKEDICFNEGRKMMSRKKIRMLFKIILGFPKSLFLNLYYFPLSKALKFPIIVTSNLKIGSLGKRGNVVVDNPYKRIFIGYGEAFALGKKNSYWEIGNNASVIFKGKATFGAGIQFICTGKMTIGDNFYCNGDCILNAGKRIKIGNDFLCGWNCEILDGDGHFILYNGERKENYSEVEIGEHVWVASGVTVLKGSRISDGSIVAAKSCISKKIEQKNVLIGRNNEILRTNVSWEK